MTALALGVFGVFGGIGNATSALKELTGISKSAAFESAGPERGSKSRAKAKRSVAATPVSDQFLGRTTICHRTGSDTSPFVLIAVDNSALSAYQAHGDIIPAPAAGCPATP